jgi:hypothetical protein
MCAGFADGSAASAEIVNKILATVDGDPITVYELKRFTQNDPRMQQIEQGDGRAVLETVIMDRIIDKEVSSLGIVVRDTDVDRYIDGIRQRNKLSDEQLRAALEQQGLTWDEYRLQVRKELQKVQLINQEIRGKVNVTPEEVERYYNANLTEYSLPEQIKISHIVIRHAPDAPQEQSTPPTQGGRRLCAAPKGRGFAESPRRPRRTVAPAAVIWALSRRARCWTSSTSRSPSSNRAIQRAVPHQRRCPHRAPRRKHGASHKSLDDLAADIASASTTKRWRNGTTDGCGRTCARATRWSCDRERRPSLGDFHGRSNRDRS